MYFSCAGYTITSTIYVSEIDETSLIVLLPFQVLFLVSSELLKCRLLKRLLANPMNLSCTPRRGGASRDHICHFGIVGLWCPRVPQKPS